jgi:hypothetical protein
VEVLVRDAETKKPIPAAEVRIDYPFARSAWAPPDVYGITGDDGIARLQAAPYGDFGIVVEANAQSYLPEKLNVSNATIEEIPRARLFGGNDGRPPNFTLEMYSGPRFSVELVVPTGFRGIVRAEVEFQNDGICPTGQRCFSFDVPASGIIQVIGPPLLRRVSLTDFSAKYADGTHLGTEMDVLKVGFRWLKTEGNNHFFVVGTSSEYDSYRRDLQAEESAKGRRADDGKGNGRGGRRRRGNQTSIE